MARNVLFYFVALKIYLSLQGTSHATNISNISAESWEEGSEYSVIASTEETLHDECYDTKHHSFCNCSSPILLLPQDYKNKSGVLHVGAFNASYNISFYRIHDVAKGYVVVCEPSDNSGHDDVLQNEYIKKHLTNLSYITIIGLGVSMSCLFIHLVVFLVVRESRNMPGYNLTCLCFSMFCGYSSLLLGTIEMIYKTSTACVALASLTHFFLLCSFFWMNVIAFDIFRSLWNSTSKLRNISTAFGCKKFAFRWLFCGGTSLAIVILSVIMDTTEGVPLQYRPLFGRSACWFHQLTATWIFFNTPAFSSIGINVIFFGLCIYVITSNRMKTDDSNRRAVEKRNLILYSKLALITGMLWLSGVLARVTDNLILWYIFAVLSVLQGFFIFLAFTLRNMSKNVYNMIFCSFRKHFVSSPTATPQSFSNSGPSSGSRV